MMHSKTKQKNFSSRIPDFIDHAPLEIGSIITGYLGEEFSINAPKDAEEKAFSLEEEKVSAAPAYSWTLNAKLGLFNNFSLRSIAHELVAGNVDAAIQGVVQLVGDCPTLMHEICEITDHRGRKLKGTLLQLAAMNFDFNPLTPEHMTKSFGAVEQLVELGLLSGEEIKNQLDAVLGPHSEKATKERTDKLKAAVERLVDDIAALNILNILNIDPNAVRDEMRLQAGAIVQKFWAALHPDGVITEGLVFDPEILSWFIERYWMDDGLLGWSRRLGGSNSTKSDLLWAVGFGSLQAADSACGLQLHRRGIYMVVEEKKIPSRADHFSSCAPSFCVELGSSEFLSLYGEERRRSGIAGGVRGAWVPLGRATLQKCFQTKTAASQKFMRTSAKPHHRPHCVIL